MKIAIRIVESFNRLCILLIALLASLYILYPIPVKGNVAVRAKLFLERNFDQTEYNRIYIPKIGVDMKIIEGDFDSAIMRGSWRDPNTSTPDEGGNTVIAAHRYLYTAGAETFYRLDEMEIDDEIKIKWEDDYFYYKVYSTGIVSKDSIGILGDNGSSILTLYTCHPLWTSDQRLVVRAARI